MMRPCVPDLCFCIWRPKILGIGGKERYEKRGPCRCHDRHHQESASDTLGTQCIVPSVIYLHATAAGRHRDTMPPARNILCHYTPSSMPSCPYPRARPHWHANCLAIANHDCVLLANLPKPSGMKYCLLSHWLDTLILYGPLMRYSLSSHSKRQR